jgi:hypothetical protein
MPNGIDRGSGSDIQPVTVQDSNHPPTLLLYTRFWEFDLRDLLQSLVAIVGRRPDVRLLVIGKGERGELICVAGSSRNRSRHY